MNAILGMLIAYDASGEIVASLHHMVRYRDDGTPEGLIDFAAHEEAGGEATDIWVADRAAGSKVWPEWLGSRVYDFRVELVGPAGNKRIGALVHKTSGHRRERAAIDAAIAARVAAAGDGPADIRDLVGGPDRPLILDDEGRTVPAAPAQRPDLPIVAVRR